MKQEILEIQSALRRLSFSEPAIPAPVVDGRSGYQTKRAVEAFQKLYGLPVNGIVDSETWDRLFEAENAATVHAPTPLFVFPDPLFTLDRGEKHAIVPIIKTMLNELSQRFSSLTVSNTADEYDGETADAIRRLRILHDLEDSDRFDIEIWNILAALYNDRRERF